MRPHVVQEAVEASARSVSAAERTTDGACHTEADALAAGMATATSFSRGANGMTVPSMVPDGVAGELAMPALVGEGDACYSVAAVPLH
jgi:hypothetical protein